MCVQQLNSVTLDRHLEKETRRL